MLCSDNGLRCSSVDSECRLPQSCQWDGDSLEVVGRRLVWPSSTFSHAQSLEVSDTGEISICEEEPGQQRWLIGLLGLLA